jgi:hypothetical protein
MRICVYAYMRICVYACIRVCVRSASFMVVKGINSVFGSCSVEIVWTNRTLPNFRFFFFIPFYFCVFFSCAGLTFTVIEWVSCFYHC